MTIFILSNDMKETALFLDDKSLDKMIKDIAQVLCNVHYMQLVSQKSRDENSYGSIPLMPKDFLKCKWSHYVRECRANYLFMVELGIALCDEHAHRFFKAGKTHKIVKFEKIMAWARDQVPDLPDWGNYKKDGTRISLGKPSPLPLVLPRKYQYKGITKLDAIESYRNFYQSKIKQKIHKIDHTIGCGCPQCDEGFENKKPKWTKRERPLWLNL